MADETVLASWFAEAESMDTLGERLEELARYERLHPLLAANPATPASVLQQFASSSNPAIRKAVALNPNTPATLLYLLAAEFPAEFLYNPALLILNMTQPDFVRSLPLDSLRSLLRFSDLPASWLKQITDDRRYVYHRPPTIQLIEMHVSRVNTHDQDDKLEVRDVRGAYQKELPEPASLSSEEEAELFLLFVLLFPFTAPMLRKQWVAAASLAPRRVAQVLALNRQPGARTLTSLAQLPDPHILRQVARHPATSPRILKHLATPWPSATPVRQAIHSVAAANPRTPLDLLSTFISAKQTYLRRIAARHPKLEAPDRSRLALDGEATVRAALASLPYLTTELFVQLANDPAPSVRAPLARNVRIPPALLSTLALDAEPVVRAASAANPRLPLESQAVLASDPIESVRSSLSGNARLSAEHAASLVRDPAPRVRAALAANPRVPIALLETLLNAEEPEVWAGLAHHPKLAPEVLIQLARRGDLRTRLAVAAHTRAPTAILTELAQENTHAMWCTLASNPNTPLNVLEQALPTSSIDLLHRLHQHPAMARTKQRPLLTLLATRLQPLIAANSVPDWLRRVYLQYFIVLPVELVSLFAISPHWQERYLLAIRPHLPETVLQQLAQDGIYPVQVAARKALERHQQVKDH